MKKVKWSLFQINLCVNSKFAFTWLMVVDYIYLKTRFYDSSLMKNTAEFIAVIYNPSLISYNKVCALLTNCLRWY